MLNYMKSEIYKAFNRKMTYVMLSVFVMFGTILPLLIAHSLGDHIYFLIGGQIAISITNMFIVQIVFSDAYKYKLFKNDISFGISRAKIYFSKLFIQILVFILLWAVTIFGNVLTGLIKFGFSDSITISNIKSVAIGLGYVLIFSIVSIVLFNAIAFITPNTTVFYQVSVGIYWGVPVVLTLILPILISMVPSDDGFVKSLTEIMTFVFDNIELFSLLSGVVGFIVLSIIGYFAFKKKEI